MKDITEAGLKRFGVSMETSLLKKFDLLADKKGYKNRSEAIRDLIRDALIQQSWEEGNEVAAGTIVLFYNHRQRHLAESMTAIQHQYHDLVLSATHFHLDHDHCLELIVVKGMPREMKQLSDRLISLKGVDYGKFTVAPVGKV